MDHDRIGTFVISTLIVVLVALLIAILTWVNRARADEQQITPGVAYCTLYAREQARIDIMHTLPITPFEAQGQYPITLAKRVFQQCLSVLPILLPLTPAHRQLDTWHTDMQAMIQWRLDQLGTRPASRGPTPAVEPLSPVDDEEWRRQCDAEYSTWDPSDGTVVRRGSPERVRCPCGGEVDCTQ